MPRQQFVAQLNAAIQAALVYPSGARALNQQGQARVGFVLRDGALEQLAIVLSSGKPGLDRAALQAVLRAHLPAVPEALRGQSLPCQISVSFSLQSRP
jgi:TonB family protein